MVTTDTRSYQGITKKHKTNAQAFGSDMPAYTILHVPKKKPRNVLPASPMKMRAGGQLNQRNPVSAPINANKRKLKPNGKKQERKKAATIQATPADRASMLSS